MRALGLEGARHGKRPRPMPRSGRRWPADLVERRFTSARPNAVSVADFEHVATRTGTVYVAFVLDAHSRRIRGWREASSMRTELVLDALEQAIRARTREDVTDLAGAGAPHECLLPGRIDPLHRALRGSRRPAQRRFGR